MTSRQLLDKILFEGPTSDTLPLELRRLFFKLHDHLPELELRNGEKLRDVADVMELCREMVDHLEPKHRVVRMPPRSSDVCGKCFHRHEGINECGVDLGGAGKCDCKAEVTA